MLFQVPFHGLDPIYDTHCLDARVPAAPQSDDPASMWSLPAPAPRKAGAPADPGYGDNLLVRPGLQQEPGSISEECLAQEECPALGSFTSAQSLQGCVFQDSRRDEERTFILLVKMFSKPC